MTFIFDTTFNNNKYRTLKMKMQKTSTSIILGFLQAGINGVPSCILHLIILQLKLVVTDLDTLPCSLYKVGILFHSDKETLLK